MMHHNGVVVAITDNKNKPYREYDFKSESERHLGGKTTKKATVLLPFDSEYKIMFKNTENKRIKVSIDLDGTNITDSGLVIPAQSKHYLERFIDISKKFKFVSKDSDGVSDPTNSENGVLKITVEKEKEFVLPSTFREQKTEVYHYYHHNTNWYPRNADWNGYEVNSFFPHNTNLVYTSNTCDINPEVQTKGVVNYSSCIRSAPLGQSGATVEGNESSQVFNETSFVNDGVPFYFEFLLRGKGEKEVDHEYEEYLRLKEKFE